MKYAWHIHHKGPLVEPLVEPIENRLKFIREVKAIHESPAQIELRIRLLKPVRGKLPDEVVRTGTAWRDTTVAYVKARAAYLEADDDAFPARDVAENAAFAYHKAGAAYHQALDDHHNEIYALHTAECVPNCPWDGKTIFPEGGVL